MGYEGWAKPGTGPILLCRIRWYPMIIMLMVAWKHTEPYSQALLTLSMCLTTLVTSYRWVAGEMAQNTGAKDRFYTTFALVETFSQYITIVSFVCTPTATLTTISVQCPTRACVQCPSFSWATGPRCTGCVAASWR